MTARPQVRDLTQRTRPLTPEVDGGSIHELLLVMWLVFDSGEYHGDHDLGVEWFRGMLEATPADLREEIEFLGTREFGAWCALRGLVARAPVAHDIDSVLDWLAGLDPAEVRRGILSYAVELPEGSALVEKAVDGDSEALEALLDDRHDLAAFYTTLFALDRGELRDRIVAALRRFREEVYRQVEDGFSSVITRAAKGATILAKGAEPERLIESVTNGLEYRIQPGVRRLVLVPSVIVRPWAVIDQHEDTLMVVFPVADEYLNADPDAPTPWMVKVCKALADEKRLRILRRLGEGPSTLDELAKVLDLSKSTVHHHVGLLRGAGLVRIVIDKAAGIKTYSLRPSILPGAHQALDEYLGMDTTESVRSMRSV